MQQSLLRAMLRYPVIACVSALAVAGTVLCVTSPTSLDALLSNTGNCLREPWRLLVPALFHEGLIHLLFNLYWLWFFGAKIEKEFGHIATIAIIVPLAVGSMAAELAIFRGGVGLSGVGYGMFGMLWVLGQTDPRFRGVVDHSIVELMLGWLLVCIILTMADVWHVGNVSHCAGCLLGALLGWTIGVRPLWQRLLSGVAFATVLALFVIGGTNVARRYVNLVDDAGCISAERGKAALEAGHTEDAIRHFSDAVDANPNVRDWWRSLAIAYDRLGQEEQSDEAYRRMNELEPGHSSSK
jgi:membrane associated rhomboid family serine protease